MKQWSNITLLSAKDLSRLHQLGPKVLPSIFLGYVLSAGRIWKGDILVAHIVELEKVDASELYAQRLKAKDVLTSTKGDNFIFPVKISGGDQRLETSTLILDRPDRGEEQRKCSMRIRRTFFNTTSRLIVI